MAIKRFDIVVPKEYQQNGETKKQWRNVGTLVYFPASGDKNEGYRLELSMFPNTNFYVFEQKSKEERASPTRKASAPEGEINIDDVPFD